MATFAVNSNLDTNDAIPGDGICADLDGNCTLRAAIEESNALSGPDVVTLPADTYTLTIEGIGEDDALTGDLDINDNLTIMGAGAGTTIIDAGNADAGTPGDDNIGNLDRVFHIPFFSPTTNVSIEDVTVRGGWATDGGLLFGSAAVGGGLFSESLIGPTVTIERSVITDNKANGSLRDGVGGGIAAFFGTISITDSVISANEALGDAGFSARGGGMRHIEEHDCGRQHRRRSG